MSDYQRLSNSFHERMRLIRFRRKKEQIRFWEEFKLVPRWLIWTVVVLFVMAQGIALAVNLSRINGQIFPEPLQEHPVWASLALAGIVTAGSLFLAFFIFLTGYVYRDAKRRGMHAGLWTTLVLILWPAYLAIGYIIYFLLREPLPYACPQCGATVGARFNYCPNCRSNLHPSCPQCKREVVETDKYCPFCGQDLSAPSAAERPVAQISR
jgi:hypothetical protein